MDVAHNGVDGLHLAMEGDYNLLVLDGMMPGIDGLGVLAALRQSKQKPVLMLAGLAVVCAAVYAVTYVNLAARQLETIAQKQTQVWHLLAESTRHGDVAMLKHKLDDFFIGHQGLALSLQRPDGSVLYVSAAGVPPSETARELRFEVLLPTATSSALTATLALDTRDDRPLLQRLGFTLMAAAVMGTVLTWDGSAQPEELEPLIAQFNDLLGWLAQAGMASRFPRVPSSTGARSCKRDSPCHDSS